MQNLLPLRETAEKHGLWADKKLGQHFLFDLNLTRRIAKFAGDLSDCTVFEIGPGPGGLTRALLESDAKAVIAIELDSRCLSALAELQQRDRRLTVIEGDALKQDLPALSDAPRKIIANLPYNVGTLLLVQWLHQADQFQSMTLLFQKEVADRIVARPRSKDYGRLSILAQYCCQCDVAFDIPASAFTPPPKVVSSLVHLTPKQRSADESCDLKTLERLTQAAFGQRRKMLRSSLKSIVPEPEALLEKINIAPTARAEELSVEDFIRLAQTL